jgi:hypothetical protein
VGRACCRSTESTATRDTGTSRATTAWLVLPLEEEGVRGGQGRVSGEAAGGQREEGEGQGRGRRGVPLCAKDVHAPATISCKLHTREGEREGVSGALLWVYHG